MTAKSFAPWLGALVATPALTVNVAPASASSIQTAPSGVAAGEGRGALQAGLLSMSLDDKLAVAGDRVGSDPLLLAVGASQSRSYGATVGRTNTDIPECHTPGANGVAKGKVNRASCQTGAAMRATVNPNTIGYACHTSTSMCTVQPQAHTAGATSTPQTSRTSAGKAVCAASPAVAKNCGATSPGSPVPTHWVGGCRPQ
jgi:hypothetical protein